MENPLRQAPIPEEEVRVQLFALMYQQKLSIMQNLGLRCKPPQRMDVGGTSVSEGGGMYGRGYRLFKSRTNAHPVLKLAFDENYLTTARARKCMAVVQEYAVRTSSSMPTYMKSAFEHLKADENNPSLWLAAIFFYLYWNRDQPMSEEFSSMGLTRAQVDEICLRCDKMERGEYLRLQTMVHDIVAYFFVTTL